MLVLVMKKLEMQGITEHKEMPKVMGQQFEELLQEMAWPVCSWPGDVYYWEFGGLIVGFR